MVKLKNKIGDDGMKKIKLLMIEDEADVLEINREYFEGNAHFGV
jgi:hypothetical protein